MDVDRPTAERFLKWFETSGGTLNTSVGISDLPAMGRGAIALHDIQKDSALFTIPRSLLLSTKTTPLRKLLGEKDWTLLGKGWQPLIVSMMWEESSGEQSPWSGYLQDMPTSFDTLMFWTQEELDELQASTIKDKVGKAEAEKDYRERVLPILQRRDDVFDTNLHDTFFSFERYHINGSRILSRSFQVEDWHGDDDSDKSQPEGDEDDEEPPELVPTRPSQEDEVQHLQNEPLDSNEDSGDEDDDSDDRDGVSMVPMADILNARQGCNNAKLFYEKDHLRMVAIRDIKAGEQIWNTYGDPPNADLVRRYGYVDLIPLQPQPTDGSFPYENPSDEVEIRADLVFDVCAPGTPDVEKTERIEIWLNLGGDDTFVIDKKDVICKPLLGMVRYLQMTPQEIEEAIEKDKLPKGKPIGDILRTALRVVRARLAQYATTLEEDETRLKGTTLAHHGRTFNAIFVRLCEKRLLRGAIQAMEEILRQEEGQSSKAPGRGKRPREETGHERKSGQKKSKR